jgi:PPM family protein phosphatase
MQSKDIETIFLHDIKDDYADLFDVGNFRIGCFISRNKEKVNQDNEDCLFYANRANGFILGVCDGAGGHPKGRDASYLIGEEFIKSKETDYNKLIESVNKKVVDLKVGAKSTLAFATVFDDVVNFYSVGDSEIVYWNAHGNEIYTSTPHSSTGHKVKAGVTSQADSLSDPERNLVNNLMGDEMIRVEFTSGADLKKGHTVILGSDGLFDNISHEQLSEIVGRGEFEKSFQDIVEICREQDKENWLKNDDTAFFILRKIKS